MYLYQPPEYLYLPLKYFIQKTLLFLKRKFKFQAAFQLIAHPDSTAMQENGILDDGKTQTGATHLAAASLIYPIETLEKTGEMLRQELPDRYHRR